MKVTEIDNFFNKLSKHYPKPAEIIIIGGAAAAIMGGVRPTLDIDFEVALAEMPVESIAFMQSIGKVEEDTGIKAQFAEDVDHWSEITLLDYRNKKKLYKTFGAINVWILEPEYWSIGKVGRFWDHDIQDMIAVFTNEQPQPEKLAQTWIRALRTSPLSSSIFPVKKQMIYFFETYGKKIWGNKFDKQKILGYFSEKPYS